MLMKDDACRKEFTKCIRLRVWVLPEFYLISSLSLSNNNILFRNKKNIQQALHSLCADKPTLYSSPSLKYQFVCKKRKTIIFILFISKKENAVM